MQWRGRSESPSPSPSRLRCRSSLSPRRPPAQGAALQKPRPKKRRISPPQSRPPRRRASPGLLRLPRPGSAAHPANRVPQFNQGGGRTEPKIRVIDTAGRSSIWAVTTSASKGWCRTRPEPQSGQAEDQARGRQARQAAVSQKKRQEEQEKDAPPCRSKCRRSSS